MKLSLVKQPAFMFKARFTDGGNIQGGLLWIEIVGSCFLESAATSESVLVYQMKHVLDQMGFYYQRKISVILWRNTITNCFINDKNIVGQIGQKLVGFFINNEIQITTINSFRYLDLVYEKKITFYQHCRYTINCYSVNVSRWNCHPLEPLSVSTFIG